MLSVWVCSKSGNLPRRELSRDRSSLFENDMRETIIATGAIDPRTSPNGRSLTLLVLHGGVSNRSRFVPVLILITLSTIHWHMIDSCPCSLPQSSSRDATAVLVFFGNGSPPLLSPVLVLNDGLWRLAATLGARSSFKRLPKRDVMGADIAQLCGLIAEPVEPLALRLSSNLMVGVAR